MQSLHVRFIFQIQIPLHGNFQGGYSFKIASSGIGISIKNQNSTDEWHYQIQILSCDGDKEFEATKSLIWAKRNPYILQTKDNTTVEGLKLRLKIKHGVFDFRKVKKRAIRFNVSCVHSATVVSRGVSEVYQLLPKKRKADDSEINEEVLVPISWSQSDEPHAKYPLLEAMEANEPAGLQSSDEEERPKKRQRIAREEVEHSTSPLRNMAHTTHAMEFVNETVEESPNSYYESAETPYHAPHDHHREFAANMHMIRYHEYLPAHDLMTESVDNNQQYMVLYNGNAEVVGNFRALNFYKASDINIKEDIRLLNEDQNPRHSMLQIDGVSYKFKDNVQHATNKRFVGYIAQQIESVVPEAVQLIDGILHVDYEALIPYLSESIKQNYNDIKSLKSESERIHRLLDSLYAEFISRHSNNTEKLNKPAVATRSAVPRASNARYWLVPLVALVFLISAAIGVFFFVSAPATPSGSALIPLSPAQISVPIPYAYPHHRDALMALFIATNGSRWIRKEKWGSDESVCDWYGVYCRNDHIRALYIRENNLVGSIPDEIGKIETLESINLAWNHLEGTIPLSLWQLSKIEDINLSQNKKLTGTIPNQKMRNLNLNLGDCNIQGTIPPTLLADTNSMLINLTSNALIGTIPPMGNANTISALHLAHNKLTGSIPILRVSNDLDLSHNNLSGFLTMIRFMTLKYLDVSHNKLNGFYWDEGEEMPRLEYMDISYNPFTYVGFEPLNWIVRVCNAEAIDFECPTLPPWFVQQCNASCN